MPKMKHRQCIIQSSLPDDVALKIASFLEFAVLEEAMRVGLYLEVSYKTKVAPFVSVQLQSSSTISQNSDPTSEGWRGFYMKRHGEMESGASNVVNYVEQCTRSNSLEVGDYLQAIDDLSTMKLGFKDVKMFLFNPKLNVLVCTTAFRGLICRYQGVCITPLDLGVKGLPSTIGARDWSSTIGREDVMEALQSCKILDRQVCVRWWKLGRWFYGFGMRDQFHSCWVSLADLAMAKEEEVLGVLQRGAIHEVLRVQIYFANPSRSLLSRQSTQSIINNSNGTQRNKLASSAVAGSKRPS
ncbi:hypothetical protein Q3G72_009246 [Acer saccharum]|nr:hypothetical protein Q3G72_009246 [Acer saccharum]